MSIQINAKMRLQAADAVTLVKGFALVNAKGQMVDPTDCSQLFKFPANKQVDGMFGFGSKEDAEQSLKDNGSLLKGFKVTPAVIKIPTANVKKLKWIKPDMIVKSALTEKQKQLDIDGDGQIDGEDLKKVREGAKPEVKAKPTPKKPS